jgi:D-alanine-D-alanine ligase
VNTGKQVLNSLDVKKYIPIAIKIPKKGNRLIPFIQKIKKVDVAFLALHGQFGEDGKIQAILETLHIPYTGSGVNASSIAMDKIATYRFLESKVIRTPMFQVLGKAKDKIKFVFPFVVKPNSSGSSVGVFIVKNKKELATALWAAFRESDKVIIEEYIRGTEYACGVLGNAGKKVKALPVIEIRPAATFFDYNSKYNDSRTMEICPAPISQKLKKKIQQTALFAHEKIGCRGLTRSDFIVKNGKVYFLEINTIPGQTKESLCPKMAKALGWSLTEFFDKQIQLALKK